MRRVVVVVDDGGFHSSQKEEMWTRIGLRQLDDIKPEPSIELTFRTDEYGTVRHLTRYSLRHVKIATGGTKTNRKRNYKCRS
jgi:hypothetical protein